MPELPEVETVRRALAARVIGWRFVSCEVIEPRLRRTIDAAGLAASLLGARIRAVERRAKYLRIMLSNEQVLVVHLGMSGRLTLADRVAPALAHEHVRLGLARTHGERDEDELELRYRDPRRFGLMFARPRQGLDDDPAFRDLGPEPLGPDFDGAVLHEAGRDSRRAIKALLMDAAVVVGVGNIYANESLHRAGIHPARAAGRISRARYEALAAAIRTVLADAIAKGGTTLQDFESVDGAEGWFGVSLDVYDREGLPCRRCAAPIRRIVQANRSTWYCPRCQR